MKDIHDSEILELSIKFREEKLVLNLISDSNEEFSIDFTEVFCFEFEEPNSYTVLYDITKIDTLDKVIATDNNFDEKLKNVMNSNLFRTPEDYNDLLLSGGYNLYVLHSSVGMHGTIIAKSMIVS
ncbi:hypothetical protein ACFO26_02960 [Lactococcus nasutitermitis]|uniref:Uncharacterized protein n=1 Tax=Lactococcus nasutitermitis TaxID=1652957 RepID=A0ABV9JC38_9LACT|nr:hypothetical protein [Lactococcus nasutitermitis]